MGFANAINSAADFLNGYIWGNCRYRSGIYGWSRILPVRSLRRYVEADLR